MSPEETAQHRQDQQRAIEAANLANIEKENQQKDEVERRTTDFLRRRVAEGSISAQYDLALRYLEGRGVAKDEVEARRLLAEAAGKGHEAARKKLTELDQ